MGSVDTPLAGSGFSVTNPLFTTLLAPRLPSFLPSFLPSSYTKSDLSYLAKLRPCEPNRVASEPLSPSGRTGLLAKIQPPSDCKTTGKPTGHRTPASAVEKITEAC